MVRIRKARSEDGEGIWRAHTQAICELCKSHYTPEEIAAWAGSLHPESYQGVIISSEFFVAEDQDRIVGFAQLHRTSGEVEAVYVHPSAARHGVGKQLLRKLEERAKANGVPVLHLDASLNAVPFYTDAGLCPAARSNTPTASGIRDPLRSHDENDNKIKEPLATGRATASRPRWVERNRGRGLVLCVRTRTGRSGSYADRPKHS
jgi:putative acetyltransferase